MKFILTTIILVLCSQAQGQLIINTNKRVAYQPPIPAPRAVEQEVEYGKLKVFAYYPTKFKCSLCDKAKAWNPDDLPFEIVWRKNNTLDSYPVFQFPMGGREGWRQVNIADREFLIKQWTMWAEKDVDKYRERTGDTRKTVALAQKPTGGSDIVCGCRGEKATCCICLKENLSGVRSKPCTCTKTHVSEHRYTGLLSNYNPQGATGRYKNLETGEYVYSPIDTSNLPAEAQPTPHKEVHRVLKMLNLDPSKTLVEYGCGYDARWAIAAASIYGCDAVGIEIDPERAESARRHVAMLGLSDKVTIIEGDATEVDIDADVGVAYLWPDVLSELKPKIEQLEKFASYQHQVPGMRMTVSGDTYFWTKPRQVRGAVWNGRVYSRPVCNRSNCAMCNSIRRQLRR